MKKLHELLYVLAVSELAAFSHRGGWFPCLPAIIREDGVKTLDDRGMTVERYQACDDKIINGYPNYPEYILKTLKEFGFPDKVLLALPCLFPVQCICGKRATVFNDDHPPVCEKDFIRWYQKEPTV